MLDAKLAPVKRKQARPRADEDLLRAVAIGPAWSADLAKSHGEEERVEWLRGALHTMCDASMPSVRERPPRRQVYWWTGEVAEMSGVAGHARCQYTRARRRPTWGGVDESRGADLYREYGSAAVASSAK